MEFEEWKSIIRSNISNYNQSDRIETLLWIILLKLYNLYQAEGAIWELEE